MSNRQLNLPNIEEPGPAERAFLVLARRWHDEFTLVDENHAPPREVDEIALACVLLAVQSGHGFTKIGLDQCELNWELASKRQVSWFEQLPWELCQASRTANPLDLRPTEPLVANLDHPNSSIRGWCMKIAWICRSWLDKDMCIPLLLKNVADTLGHVQFAMGLARRLCASTEELEEYIGRYGPPVAFADQFARRIKVFRNIGFFLTQAVPLDLECRCRRLIESAVFGPLE